MRRPPDTAVQEDLRALGASETGVEAALSVWRNGTMLHPWLRKLVFVFERRERLRGEGCEAS